MTTKTIFITQEQFAKSLINRLNDTAEMTSPNISERLRFARERALAAQKAPAAQTAWSLAPQVGGALALGGGNADSKFDLFSKWGSLLPLIALVVGMFAINHIQNDFRAQEVADVDSALLTDDLPPAAYADAGFGQFLKLQSEH